MVAIAGLVGVVLTSVGIITLPADLMGVQAALGFQFGELPRYRQVCLVLALLWSLAPWCYILWLQTRPTLGDQLNAVSPADARLFLYRQRTEARAMKLAKRKAWADLAAFLERQLNIEVPQMLEQLYGKAERAKFTKAMEEAADRAQSPTQMFASMNRYLLDLFAVRGQRALEAAMV